LEAHLDNVSARHTHFEKAHFQAVQMRNAKLVGAQFDGAKLGGVNLRGTDLSECVGLDRHALEGTMRDEHTKLPPEFADMIPAPKTEPANDKDPDE
jgi:uncharacterized protein YjbI with pentapeptide repeats